MEEDSTFVLMTGIVLPPYDPDLRNSRTRGVIPAGLAGRIDI